MLFELENADTMIKSWLDIVDFNTHHYKSGIEKGSPYDLSKHHSHDSITFDSEHFNSYLGAGLIKDVSLDDLPFSDIEFKGMKLALKEVDERNNSKTYVLKDITEHPLYVKNIRTDTYNQIDSKHTRNEFKAVRYYNYKTSNDVLIQFKEKESLELLMMSILKSNNPVVSCSFGKDSLVTLHLTLRVFDMLNIERGKLNVFYSDTLNEFPEIRKLSKKLEKEWGFNLMVGKPKKPLKKIIEEYGGMDESYFTRKGDRTNDRTPLSEVCCSNLKHKPYKEFFKKHDFDLNITGLRSEESVQRLQAGLRDGEYYYAKSEWKSCKINPILHWRDEDVFSYIKKYLIPMPKLYNQNMIMNYNNLGLLEQERLIELGIDNDVIHDPLLALELKKDKTYRFNIYMPRVGCQICIIPIKYGYLRWLRRFYPNAFRASIFNFGYGKILWKMINNSVKREVEFFLNRKIDFKDLTDKELLKDIVEYRPCTFDMI
ncbi:phosphoadenosine phosphosulfate reductase family protein (plasmid) [Mycoplasmatota bacterium]|nr:phosphoadenosine phosphosulfate reductase family protein [Mycoplasmatota bacterium]